MDLEGKRILIVQRGGLGDVCLGLSLIQALRRAGVGSIDCLPTGQRDWAADMFLAEHDQIDGVLDFRQPVPAGQYDLAIVWDVAGDHIELPVELEVLRLLGQDTWAKPTSYLESLAAQLTQAGLDLPVFPARLDMGGDPARDLNILVPGSGDPRKCWPREGWEGLAEALQARGERCWWLTGPLERKNPAMFAWIHDRDEPCLQGSLAVVAGYLAVAGRVWACDCGIAHLAAVLGRPTTVIISPKAAVLSPISFWRPPHDWVKVCCGRDLLPTVNQVLDAIAN